MTRTSINSFRRSYAGAVAGIASAGLVALALPAGAQSSEDGLSLFFASPLSDLRTTAAEPLDGARAQIS